jgi:hypothetical protein
MKSNTTLWIAMAVVTVIAVVSLFTSISGLNKLGSLEGQVNTLGAAGTRFPNGLSTDSTSPVAGELRGTSFKLTSTATTTLSFLSTSATKGFCINLNATSTNTLLNLTATSSTQGNVSGLVLSYGACN